MKLGPWFWNILRKILCTIKYEKSEFEKCGKHQNMFSDHWHKTKELCKICNNIVGWEEGRALLVSQKIHFISIHCEISYRMWGGNFAKRKAMLKNSQFFFSMLILFCWLKYFKVALLLLSSKSKTHYKYYIFHTYRMQLLFCFISRLDY